MAKKGKLACGQPETLDREFSPVTPSNRSRRSAVGSPNDFNPFAEKPQKIVLKGAEMLDVLKAAFIRKR